MTLITCMLFRYLRTGCSLAGPQRLPTIWRSQSRDPKPFLTQHFSYCRLQQHRINVSYYSGLRSKCAKHLFQLQRQFVDPIRSACVVGAPRYYSKKSADNLSVEHGVLKDYLDNLVEKYKEASQVLLAADGSEKTTKDSNRTIVQLGPLVKRFKEYRIRAHEIRELESFITGDDHQMAAMAKEEQDECLTSMAQHELEILSLLIPEEPVDHNDIIMEFTSGVGGQEAMLFNNEMYEMYRRFAVYKRWQCEVLDYEETESGGLRHASLSISGDDVYKHLKYEGGVHRVQRIPKTEKAGRVHTSTMAVAILPQPTEIDVVLNPKDLKIDTYKASGAGGQHVNTTNSAVRVTHVPSGTVAECQAGRSQIKNKDMAINILRSRIYQRQLDQQLKEQQSKRMTQFGTGARSDKVRTYNFNQDRVTDHRVGENMHNLSEFLSGGEGLETMISVLQKAEKEERLREIIECFRSEEKKALKRK